MEPPWSNRENSKDFSLLVLNYRPLIWSMINAYLFQYDPGTADIIMCLVLCDRFVPDGSHDLARTVHYPIVSQVTGPGPSRGQP